MPRVSSDKAHSAPPEGEESKRRDLAADLSPEAMLVWPRLTAFGQFLTKHTLNGDRRCMSNTSRLPTGLATPTYHLESDEDDIVGAFLFSLLMAGALYRATIHHDLVKLTTDNVILQGRWFQIDAFKPHAKTTKDAKQSRRPERRNLQIRFPLPLPTRCLLYRVAIFSGLLAVKQNTGAATPSRQFDFPPGQPLFSERIRKQKNFLHSWLTNKFAKFQETDGWLLPIDKPIGTPFPKPTRWPPSWNQIRNACQANLLSSLPPWVVAGLSRRWMSRPSTILDIQRVLLDEYPSPAGGSPVNHNPEGLKNIPSPHFSFPVRPAPSTLPSRLKKAYTEINRLLGTTAREPRDDSRRMLLAEVDAILKTLSPTIIAADRSIPRENRPLYDNARLLFQWLRALIQSRRSLRTVRLYFFNLLLFVYEKFGRTPLSAVDDGAMIVRIIADCMRCYDNPESQRNVKKSFRSFYKYASSILKLPALPWNDQDLWVYRDAEDRLVFTFRDIDHLLNQVAARATLNDYSDVQTTRLQSFFILCFYAGLRREEVAQLRVADFQEGVETVLWVGHSKTTAGIRVIPLSLLVPEKELGILHRQYQTAQALASGRATSDVPLVPSDDGGFCRPDSLGNWASRLLQEYLGAGSAHDLRHSFATWFLVRWYLAFHSFSQAQLPQAFRHRVFLESEMKAFRQLFLRQTQPDSRKGATAVTRPLFVLQTLIGHACPEITLSVYAHSLDWIYYLYLLRSDPDHPQPVEFPSAPTIAQAATLLRQTPESLRARRRKGQKVPNTLEAIVKEQMTKLGL